MTHIKDLIRIRKEEFEYNYNIRGDLGVYSNYTLDKYSARESSKAIEYAEDMVKDDIIRRLMDVIYGSRGKMSKAIGDYIILSPEEYCDLVRGLHKIT